MDHEQFRQRAELDETLADFLGAVAQEADADVNRQTCCIQIVGG